MSFPFFVLLFDVAYWLRAGLYIETVVSNILLVA